MPEFKIVCGNCGTPAEIFADADGQVAVCPTCGQRDDLKDAQGIAGKHFLQQALPDSQRGIDQPFSGKFSTLEAARMSTPTFRWHASAIG